jgi:uncharacterized protein YaiE (UPF0345 family)
VEWTLYDSGSAQISTANAAVSASSIFNRGQYAGSYAMDGSASTFWNSSGNPNSSPEWVACRFTSSPSAVASFSLQATASYTQAPTAFVLQQSTDGGVTWTALKTYTATWSSAGQTQTFTVPAPVTQRGNIAYDQIRTSSRKGNGSQFQMFGGGAVTSGHLAAYDSNGNVIDGGAPSSAGAVSSVFGRTGAVVAASGDYTAAMVTNAVDSSQTYANPSWITSLAYSKITGAPAAYVLPAATATVLGGVKIGANITVQADGTISVAAPPTIPVGSVFGRTGAVVAAAGDYTASQITNAVDATQSYANPAWITSLAWSKITGAPVIYVDPLTTTGDMLYRSSSATTRLGIGSSGQVLTVSGGLPVWATPSTAPVTSVFTRTGAITAAAGDYSAFYPSLTGSYSDPSWITGLSWSKIIGVPSVSSYQTPWLSNINGAGFQLQSAGKIGVGVVPNNQIEVLSSSSNAVVSVTGDFAYAQAEYAAYSYSGAGNPSSGSYLLLSAARGTRSTPAAMQFGDVLGLINFNGWGAAWVTGASITAAPNSAFSSTSAETYLAFGTTPSGSTSVSERMRITGAGNVGIGKTGPAYMLDVNGDCNLSSGSVYRINGVPLATGVSSVFTRTGAITAQSGDYTAAQVTNAVDQTASYANPAWITSLAWSKITGAPSLAPGGSNTQIQFNNSGAFGGSSYLTWDNTNHFLALGGTPFTNATFVITAVTAAGPLLMKQPLSTSNCSISCSNDQAGGGYACEFGMTGSAITAGALSPNQGYINMWPNCAAFSIAANAAPKVTVTYAGNVGIGTTSPSNMLDIYSTGVATLAITSDGQWSRWSGYAYSGSAANFGSVINMYSARGTKAAPTATQAGDWLGGFWCEGYGTSFYGSAYILAVAGSSFSSSSGEAMLQFATCPSGSTSAVERMRIASNGNVGIGMAPTYLLQLNKSVSAVNAVGPCVFLDRNNDTLYGGAIWTSYNSGGVDYLAIGVGSNFNPTSNPIITIQATIQGAAGGNVGIGTSTPSHTLHLGTDDAAKTSTSTWAVTSDARAKCNVRDLSGGLSVINQLRPIEAEFNGLGGTLVGSRAVGFLAQEVQKVLPQCVTRDSNGVLGLNIHEVLIHAVLAIKQLQAAVNSKEKN